jgi:DNA polymerase iota
MAMQKVRPLRRDDTRIILHFDYDCFYAAVVENENPALKSVPLCIQQKQIIATCNYPARARGLYKLQLVSEVKQVCPEAVIILGEDLTRFRNASKELYGFLQERIWSGRAERLGFDEVWLDVTDMIEYNLSLVNHNDLSNSFFCMKQDDPTAGFSFDATTIFGKEYPESDFYSAHHAGADDNTLILRLRLGSHLAQHLRHELEAQKGYTATVGISTNKVLSKLVGNVNKPKNQTTLMPPYEPVGDPSSTVTAFMDDHSITKVPNIGYKMAKKIMAQVLGRDPKFHDDQLIIFGTEEKVSVSDVRHHPGMGSEMLEDLLGGPGAPRGIGGKVWELLHGVDDTEVGKAKRVPSQISQEDSYMKYLHTFEEVRRQLFLLSKRLIDRMHIDLMEDDDEFDGPDEAPRRWMARPRTLRLSTRPRPPLGPDGTRSRTFHRISRSAPMPNFVFSLHESPTNLAERLVEELLIGMFRKLHPEKIGWNLSLINLACTNMAETAAETKDSEGRDIGRMFRRQDDFLKDFRIIEEPSPPQNGDELRHGPEETEAEVTPDPGMDYEPSEQVRECKYCHAVLPDFALTAHEQYHQLDQSSPREAEQ